MTDTVCDRLVEAVSIEDRVLPRTDEWDVYPRTAAATAIAAQTEDVARNAKPSEQILRDARERIGNAREMTRLLQQEGLIALPE